MEVLLVYNFKVKSIIRDYFVEFITNSQLTLKNELKEGDVVIIDKKISTLYPDLKKISLENNLLIEVSANENQKVMRV